LEQQRWSQIEELFHRACECDPLQRAHFLDESCNGDTELRGAVDALLANDERADHDLQTAVWGGLDAVAFPLVGETISHYRILGGIDTGGMGSVYRAEDIKLGRKVALKFLAEEVSRDPAALSRFEREARAASALEHPNICTIHEFGEHAGQPFLVMQLLEGQTLRELISRNGHAPLAIPEILNFGLQIAGALDAAHRHGIIHRDIKPANIFITSQGQAKILDFGLAKSSYADVAEAESEFTVGGNAKENKQDGLLRRLSIPEAFLSRTGVAIGTSVYMSPEQARGEKLDARTDIFSFGLVLYEMATGRRAFEGATEPILHDVIFRQTPAPARQLNPTLPARFQAIVHRALEGNRDSRYQTAAELRADLEEVKRATEGRKAFRLRVFLSVALLALLMAGGALTWFAKRAPPLHTGADIRFRRLTGNAPDNPVTSGAISPSGKYLAYVDSQGMHVKDIDTGETRPLAPPHEMSGKNFTWEIVGPAWFPDSARLVANAHAAGGFERARSSQTTSIWLFSRTNATPQKLREHAVAWSVSPDGSVISFGTNHGSVGERENWQMSADGQNAHKVFETADNSSIYGFFWSPGGQRGIYERTDPSGDTLFTRDINGGSPVTAPTAGWFNALTPDSSPSDLSWLPDGRVLYPGFDHGSRSGDKCNFWATRLDPHTGQPLGKPERVTHWTGSCYVKANGTADGRRLAFLQITGSQFTVAVADLEAGGMRIGGPRPISLEQNEFVFDWTADSRTLIVGVARDDGFGLYAQHLNSSSRQALAPVIAGAWPADAGMSPDGRWVIAGLWPLEGAPSAANPDAPLPLVRIPIAGGAPETILHMSRSGPFSCTRPPANVCVLVEQTADGHQMIVTEFDVIQGRGRVLARVDLARKLDFSDNPLAAISPEGTRLAVARSPDGPIEIRSLRGQPTFTVAAEGLDTLWVLAWAPDGKGLMVHRHAQGGEELLHVDLNGGVTRLWKFKSPRSGGILSPDGRHLAISDYQQDSNMWMMEDF
jgi:Tol biopolymer transport system component